jgi:hypothetical protein
MPNELHGSQLVNIFFVALRPNAGHGLLIPEVFLDHTQRRITFGRTPLDKCSARRRALYLTTHNTHNRQTSMPPGGTQTHNLSRRAAADLRLRPRGHWNRQLVHLVGFIIRKIKVMYCTRDGTELVWVYSKKDTRCITGIWWSNLVLTNTGCLPSTNVSITLSICYTFTASMSVAWSKILFTFNQHKCKIFLLFNYLIIKYTLIRKTFTYFNGINIFWHCATSRSVASSIPDGVIGIFHWRNPSGRTMALGSTQPVTEMFTRNISWEVKAAGAQGWKLYHLRVSTVLKSGKLKLLEPSGRVQACNGIVFCFKIFCHNETFVQEGQF